MSNDFACGTCYKVFRAGWRARESHLRSTGHRAPAFECDTCARYFGSESARHQHMAALNHFQWECSVCDETWPTEGDMTEHECWDHYYCRECQRTFSDSNSLEMHLNSRRHRGQQVACPFCEQGFTTATGLTHHLERGACPRAAGLNRDTLYKFVRRKDRDGVITKGLIGWHGSAQYEATDRAYNYRLDAWECYFCDRLFDTRRSLTQHLNSPVHQQSLYHCPKRSCGREFTTFAAVINHFESETCGYIRFERVQRSIQGWVSGRNLLTL